MDIFSFEKFFSAYILDLSPISLMRSGFNIKCFNFSTQSDSEFTKPVSLFLINDFAAPWLVHTLGIPKDIYCWTFSPPLDRPQSSKELIQTDIKTIKIFISLLSFHLLIHNLLKEFRNQNLLYINLKSLILSRVISAFLIESKYSLN